jgi:hypothetical protein
MTHSYTYMLNIYNIKKCLKQKLQRNTPFMPYTNLDKWNKIGTRCTFQNLYINDQ